eukprot:7706185-Lingulodinium_polyedra.AAC.1
MGSKGQVVPRERRNSGDRAERCGGGPWAAGIRARWPSSCGEPIGDGHGACGSELLWRCVSRGEHG